jgi:hypothetical protein
MAGVRRATGPAEVDRKTLMILTDINPARRMGCEGRASKMTAVAADGIATAVKIEAMTSLAAAQIIIGLSPMSGQPTGRVSLIDSRRIRTAVRTSVGNNNQKNQAQQHYNPFHLCLHIFSRNLSD